MAAISAEQFRKVTAPPSKQSWKSDPNQMAFPGMEEGAHPGALHLAQGYHFKIRNLGDEQTELSAHHEDWGEQPVGVMDWRGKGSPSERSDTSILRHPKGEITWVSTNENHEGVGLATAMYGVGRKMARVKPRHSRDRTEEGDEWAPKASAVHGGPVPKSILQESQERPPPRWARF